METKHERNYKIDFLKGIATFFVLYGHSFLIGYALDPYENRMFKFISSFHMPLFMMLSGYVFFYLIKKKWNEIAIKRSLLLSIPILVWGSAQYIVNNILLCKESISLTNWLFSITSTGLWFLFVLILCNIMVISLNKIINSVSVQLVAHVTVFFIFVLMCDYIQAMRMVAFLYPYFVLGIYANQFKSNLFYLIRNVLAAIFPVALLYYGNEDYIYTTGIAIFSSNLGIYSQIGIDIYRWLIGLSGISFIIIISDYLDSYKNTKIYQFVVWIGKHSLQFYCLNWLILTSIGLVLKQLKQYGFICSLLNNEIYFAYIVTPINTVLSIGIICILVKLFEKNKYISLCLFGR